MKTNLLGRYINFTRIKTYNLKPVGYKTCDPLKERLYNWLYENLDRKLLVIQNHISNSIVETIYDHYC